LAIKRWESEGLAAGQGVPWLPSVQGQTLRKRGRVGVWSRAWWEIYWGAAPGQSL